MGDNKENNYKYSKKGLNINWIEMRFVPGVVYNYVIGCNLIERSEEAMKILLIDDDLVTQVAVSKKLKSKGHDVTVLDDGVKALDLLKDKNYDLIISDILMPGISGLDLLNLLKRFYLNKIPLIIMSSLHEKDLISLSFDLGACDFIPKPINFNSLNKKIQAIEKTIKRS